MSINKYQPHLLVLPEDDANRQIATGFMLDSNLDIRAIQVLPASGGWKKVLEDFSNIHAPEMRNLSKRNIVLLIDFDRDENRLSYVKNQMPEELKERVFVLGVFDEPESLTSDIKMSFENIGVALAKDCAENTNELWGHELLKHNKTELDRMVLAVKPFLFN